MKKKQQGTRVAVGITDGYRYVGIERPLNHEEAEVLGIELNEYNQIITPGPAATLLPVSGDNFRGGPNQRTEQAFTIANEIAMALRSLRQEDVNVLPNPVRLQGYNSTPFNPFTD